LASFPSSELIVATVTPAIAVITAAPITPMAVRFAPFFELSSLSLSPLTDPLRDLVNQAIDNKSKPSYLDGRLPPEG
jgi:hypothetical protein